MADSSSGRFRPWIALAILTSLYTAAFIDRQVLNLLVDPIKRSLSITETQFSLLQGLAFMLSFALLSPVAGRLVDRLNRPMLLAGAALTWSLFTIACGLADSFTALFLARVGLGAAEAFITPGGWSFLASLFDRRRLPRALSIYLMAPYIGGGLALIFGGLLIDAAPTLAVRFPLLAPFEPWQRVFVVIGVPGILLALLALLLREPRQAGGGGAAIQRQVLPLRQAFGFLWEGRKFFLRFSLAMACVDMALYALPAWMPAVLIRSFGADPTRTGIDFGTVALVTGIGGVLSGPFVGRLLAARFGDRGLLLVTQFSAIGLVVAGAFLLVAGSYGGGLVAAAIISIFFTLPQATAAAALQIASRDDTRGLVTALYTFIVALVGLAIAPTLVALLTDHLFGDPKRVQHSLSIVLIGSALLGFWLTRSAIPHFRPAENGAPA